MMRRKIKTKNKKCYFTEHGIKHIDYRDVHLLKKFIDSHGRVLARSRTGVSAKSQRKLALAIKQSRIMGFMPFVQN